MSINTSKKINIFLSLLILAIVPMGEVFAYMALPDRLLGFPLHFLLNQSCDGSCFSSTNLIIDLLIALGLAMGLVTLYKHTGKRFIVAESLYRGIVAGYLGLIVLAGPSYTVEYIIFLVFLLSVFIISKNTLSQKMRPPIESLQGEMGEIKLWFDSRLSLYFMILYLFVQILLLFDMYKTVSMQLQF